MFLKKYFGYFTNDVRVFVSMSIHLFYPLLTGTLFVVSGVEFTSGGSSNTDTGKVSGNLETKYKFKEHGLTFTEKWNTDNQLCTTIDLQDKILKGLKVTFDSSFSPQTG